MNTTLADSAPDSPRSDAAPAAKRPGDILLAQDNSGTGHKWRLIGDEPWRRAYVVYEKGGDLRFTPANRQETT